MKKLILIFFLTSTLAIGAEQDWEYSEVSGFGNTLYEARTEMFRRLPKNAYVIGDPIYTGLDQRKRDPLLGIDEWGWYTCVIKYKIRKGMKCKN